MVSITIYGHFGTLQNNFREVCTKLIGTWYQCKNERLFSSWQVLEIVLGFQAIFVHFKELSTTLLLHITEFFRNVNCIKICRYMSTSESKCNYHLFLLMPIPKLCSLSFHCAFWCILIYLIFRILVHLLLLTFLWV